MEKTTIALRFTPERQMEITEIVVDADQAAALEFVKTMHRELRERGPATCGDIFRAPASGNASGPESDAHKENHP